MQFLHHLFPKKEWITTLFYKIEGTFDDLENLKIHIKYFHLNDIGSHSYTTGEMNDDFFSLIDINPELEECHQGVMHTH